MVDAAPPRSQAREGSARQLAFTPDDEQAWVEGIRRGDRGAFEAMVRAFGPALVRFAYRLVEDAEESEDLVQEVFWQIWQAGTKWRAPGSLRAYLFIAVQNRARAVHKHRSIRVKHELRVREVQELALGSAALADPSHFIAGAGVPDERLDAVRAAFRNLTERQQLALWLRYDVGVKYVEIGAALGTGRRGGEQLLERALKALRKALGHERKG